MQINNQNIEQKIKREREFWNNELISIFIKVPKKSLKCKTGNINLINNANLINPLLAKCSNYKCHIQIYLRPGTIFESYKKTPA